MAMPSRNIIRHDVADAYYHLYARGANKQDIFNEAKDKDTFLGLLERYLSDRPAASPTGEPYPKHGNNIELLAYCLMDNHFHLFVYQRREGGVSSFMRSLMTSYVRYFNLKYARTGSLFESRFKASHIYDDAYLQHISRYIHLNPRSWKYFPYSSINYYRKGKEPDWLKTEKVLELFDYNRKRYMDFLYDYEEYKATLDEIKYDIADR